MTNTATNTTLTVGTRVKRVGRLGVVIDVLGGNIVRVRWDSGFEELQPRWKLYPPDLDLSW